MSQNQPKSVTFSVTDNINKTKQNEGLFTQNAKNPIRI